LIMPRPFLRDEHVAGLTAEQISLRFGAPYQVVAQQLLDALLLPQVEQHEERQDTRPLNAAQGAAAKHRGNAMLLEAGPGTGKTKTLVGRVVDLIERDDEDPRGIVVLTYSNKAAGELSERIALKVPEAAAAMSIGTFHAYGLNLVRQLHSELGFDREPRLLDRAEAIELMLDPLACLGLVHYRDLYDPTDKLRDLLAAVSRAQDEVVSAEEYAEHVERMAADGTEPAERVQKAREVALVYRAYSRLKKSLGLVDFGDLVAMPAELLARRPELAAQVRLNVKHVLVDEYQDVNRASVQLLKALSEEGRNLWCVGDVRQSIYRFRGASSLNLARFDSGEFPNAERQQLVVNYRSSEEIVDAYSAFARDMKIQGATPVDLLADRGRSGHRPEFRHVEGTAEREIDAVADAVEELRADGVSYRDQALLCNGNERLAKIGAGLEARGIPVL
jgi:superfamily I DNA/RNA helicase